MKRKPCTQRPCGSTAASLVKHATWTQIALVAALIASNNIDVACGDDQNIATTSPRRKGQYSSITEPVRIFSHQKIDDRAQRNAERGRKLLRENDKWEEKQIIPGDSAVQSRKHVGEHTDTRKILSRKKKKKTHRGVDNRSHKLESASDEDGTKKYQYNEIPKSGKSSRKEKGVDRGGWMSASSKGKSKGGGGDKQRCTNYVAAAIQEAVSEVITATPTRCCDCSESEFVAVFVTHGKPNEHTDSGFDLFWDQIYAAIAKNSEADDVCFVMTGIDSRTTNRDLSAVLIDVNRFVSSLPNVPSMMVTDPTESVALIQEIRMISESAEDRLAPNIGIFNAGYANILIESIVAGKDAIPFVGVLDDASFGASAAEITIDLLGGSVDQIRPLCFTSGRPELGFMDGRCVAYYTALGATDIQPQTGVPCTKDNEESVAGLTAMIVDSNINAVFTQVNCCMVVAMAVARAQDFDTSRKIVLGCQDTDTTKGSGNIVRFVTAQPIALQGYTASSWANFAVIEALHRGDQAAGRGDEHFPALGSVVETAVFNTALNQ
jgi:hypothetical protein